MPDDETEDDEPLRRNDGLVDDEEGETSISSTNSATCADASCDATLPATARGMKPAVMAPAISKENDFLIRIEWNVDKTAGVT